MLLEADAREKDGSMKKIRLTTSGKIFFGIILFVLIAIFIATFLKGPTKLMVNLYCVPDCSAKQLPIGYTTLIKGCYVNQTECQMAASTTTPIPENNGRLLIGIKDSVHKVQGIGTVKALNLNVTKIYVRENNQTDWINVFDGSKTFDIAALQNQTAIITDTNIPIKTYSQEKIVLGMGNITINSLIFNIYNRNYTLSQGTNETVLSYSFTPSSSATTILFFDLIVENSIRHTDMGYFLFPQFNMYSSTLLAGQQLENSIFIS